MSYFKDVKKGDKVVGLVFGPGKVVEVYEPDSFYAFEVDFKNGYQVPYTIDGIPAWGRFDEQTLFYKKDIDLSECDHEGVVDILPLKKIVKLLSRGKLEVKTPSGVWHNATKVERSYLEKILEDKLFFLVREVE